MTGHESCFDPAAVLIENVTTSDDRAHGRSRLDITYPCGHQVQVSNLQTAHVYRVFPEELQLWHHWAPDA